MNQPVRNLCEQAGSISGAISCTGTPVVEPLQALHSQTGHPVRRCAVECGDEPNAASVVFDAWIDMRCRQSEPRVENGTL